MEGIWKMPQKSFRMSLETKYFPAIANQIKLVTRKPNKIHYGCDKYKGFN